VTTIDQSASPPVIASDTGLGRTRPALRPVRSVRTASFFVVGALILVGTLLLPYALMLGAASVARLLYPVYALILGLVVMTRYPSAYPALCVGFCAFSPFLRRIADFSAGFVQVNPILLASLVVLLPTLPSLFRRILTPGAALAVPFGLMVACLTYGSVLALYDGKLIQGFYEPAWWVLPPALATYVMERPGELLAIRRAMIQALILIVPIISVYGMLQFVSPQPWDIIWMQNVDNATFGRPIPYEVRVFSMLNSPGTAGVFTAYAMLTLCGGGIIGMIAAISAIPLLLLTIIRTAWLATAVGLVSVLAFAPARQRLQLVLAFTVALVAFGAVISSPIVPVTVKNMIEDRANSFVSLGTDASANDRRDTYASFYNRLADSPLGEGFGANGSAIAASQKRDLPALDSGILEIFLTFGLPVGIVYMYFLCAVTLAAWRGLRLSRGVLSSSFAVLVATLAIIPLGLSMVGETGAVQWTSIGLLLTLGAQSGRPIIRG